MDPIIGKKISIWIIISGTLMGAYFIGFFFLAWGMVLFPVLLVIPYFGLGYFEKAIKTSIPKQKGITCLYFGLNLLFAFVIGASIPLMESEVSYNMAYFMIPLLIILNYIILDRFQIYSNKQVSEKRGDSIGEK